jgi:uncharacterized protein
LIKALIISDTHMPKKGNHLPDEIQDRLSEGVDYILHAGDWSDRTLYEELCKWGTVYGVRGNVEAEDWKDILPDKQIIEIGHLSIGIVHGHLGKGKATPERAFHLCQDDDVDLIIFGHSHIPFLEKRNNKILFNPGSPTDKRRQKEFSYGLLTVGEKSFQLEHIYFTK